VVVGDRLPHEVEIGIVRDVVQPQAEVLEVRLVVTERVVDAEPGLVEVAGDQDAHVQVVGQLAQETASGLDRVALAGCDGEVAPPRGFGPG